MSAFTETNLLPLKYVRDTENPQVTLKIEEMTSQVPFAGLVRRRINYI
jgi:hypothetical protein